LTASESPGTVSGPGSRTLRARIALRRGWRAFLAWFDRREFSENSILLGFSVVIGVGAALGVVLFYRLIDLAYLVFIEWPTRYIDIIPVWRPLLTAGGLAFAFWVMRRFARGREDGLNIPDVQLAVARRGGFIPLGPALARTAASAITLGSGGSAGSEGPVAVLGSTLGSWLARTFRFNAERVRVLVAAGAAAGISAAFNAPLAGAFFALEEILGTLGVSAFPPVVVASVLAAVVSHAFFGNHPAFPVPEAYGWSHPVELLVFYPLLGLVAAWVSVVFVRTYFGTGDLVQRLRIPPTLVPWIAGFVVGALVLASGGILVGYGHLALHIEVFGRMPWYLLGLLVFGKILATSLTLQGGGSGGVFTPSLYIGAATGGALGGALSLIFPGLALAPEAYALVGMGAVVAAATAAPITGILIVFEMTNDYAIVLPLMLATVIAYAVARRIEPDSLYSGWLRRKGEHIEHGAVQDVLAGIRVRDALEPNPQVIGEGATVAQLMEHLDQAGQTEFPVVDGEARLRGMITVAELARVARDPGGLGPLVVAADIAQASESVGPDDSLGDAIRRMGVRGAAALPVVDPATDRLLGIVTRAHVLAVYERTVAARSRP
jgi:CIC family chloride channel protein